MPKISSCCSRQGFTTNVSWAPSLFLRNEVDVVEFFIESDDVPHQVKVFHWNLVISAVYLAIFIQYNFSLAWIGTILLQSFIKPSMNKLQ